MLSEFNYFLTTFSQKTYFYPYYKREKTGDEVEQLTHILKVVRLCIWGLNPYHLSPELIMLIKFSGESSKIHAGIYIKPSVFLLSEIRAGSQ